MMLWKCCTQYARKFGKLSSERPEDWKISVFIPITKKGNAKECSSCCTVVLISYASKVMLKILQAVCEPRTSRYLAKAEEPEIKFSNSVGSWQKQRNSRKTPTSASLSIWKPLTVWIMTNCGKLLKRWEYQTTVPTFWEACMQVKKQSLKLDVEQLTGSQLGNKYVKAVYCNPVYVTSIENTSCEKLGWINHKLKSRLLGEIPTTSDMQMIPP